MKRIFGFVILSLFTLCVATACGGGRKSAETQTTVTEVSTYPQDTIKAANGQEMIFRFYGHSSLAVSYGGKWFQIDPVGENADYSGEPKADFILVTHDHYDHLDTAVVAMLSKPETRVICNAVSAAALGYGEVMANGDTLRLADDMLVEAVPAYNFTPGHENFHPAGGRDNGYLLTLGGTRVYIAGDSENTPEMMAMKDIDIAFLPVNQPYTMTVDQAVEAVKAIKPRIFYPYHYGQVEEKTDMDRLVEEVKDITEVRVRPME